MWLETVTDFGTKYGDPFSMVICVYGAVASVGHAPNIAAVTIAMMRKIRVMGPFSTPTLFRGKTTKKDPGAPSFLS
jgi:hypothetical protein